MSDQVCKKLTKEHWRKYDTSSVPEKPGIYAIGEKSVQWGNCVAVRRSIRNDLKRRLDEHKTPPPQQLIDLQVAGRFQQHQESKLRIKAVPERRQKALEGAYIDGITKKIGYRPVLNLRAGDHSSSSAGGHKRHKPQSAGSRGRSAGRAPSARPSTGVRSSAARASSSSRRR